MKSPSLRLKSSVIALAVFLSIPLGPTEAQAACNPKRINTHDCLPTMPLYSYSLALPSDYKQALCLKLGSWQGVNAVVLEWDELQTKINIQGQSNKVQYLQPKLREGRGNALMVYSDQPILPELQFRACDREAGSLTIGQWLDSQQLATQLSTSQISASSDASATERPIAISD